MIQSKKRLERRIAELEFRVERLNILIDSVCGVPNDKLFVYLRSVLDFVSHIDYDTVNETIKFNYAYSRYFVILPRQQVEHYFKTDPRGYELRKHLISISSSFGGKYR